MNSNEPLHPINLTPHDVVLDLGGGETLRIPAAGVVPRLLLSEGRQERLRVVIKTTKFKKTDDASQPIPKYISEKTSYHRV